MAAHTSRIRCGIVVTGVTYRHPAVLANMAVTIDHVSGGRLELGIGGAWFELEHRQYGIPFPPYPTRAAMLREASLILKSMWTNERTTFSGEHFQLTEARCEPKPLQATSIPLWIGGAGELYTLCVVAEVADGWNTFLTSEDEYRHKLDVLAGHCAAVGRDPGDIRKALVFSAILGETEAGLHDRVRERAAATGIDAEELRLPLMVLTADRCAEILRPYVGKGVGDFLLLVRPPADETTMELLATKVARLAQLKPPGDLGNLTCVYGRTREVTRARGGGTPGCRAT